MRIARLANVALSPFGLKAVKNGVRDALYYQHDYGSAGYGKYREAQISANKKKFDKVWAEEQTLENMARYLETNQIGPLKGLCHGARNGWEVQWLRNRLNCEVIGTDISETANGIENMVQHDFHEEREEWKGQFSFVYTNSLDQAFDPAKALDAWSGQLAKGGFIFIEHTMSHSPAEASEMDPFGAHPLVMPYFFFEWGRGRYELASILKLTDVAMSERGVLSSKGDVWLFVLRTV